MGRKGSVMRKNTTAEFSVKTEFDEALKLLEKFGGDRKKMMRRLLSGIGTSAKAKVKKAYKTYGLHKNSGELYKSIKSRVVRSGRGVIIDAKAQSDGGIFYGYALAKGARITAKDGDFLSFQKDGKWIRAKEVKLPERDFVARPVEEYLKTQAFKDRLDSLVQKEIDRIEKESMKK